MTAALGAVVPAVGGLIWLGKLENRVEQLEVQVRSIKPATALDPVRARCADLAAQASQPNKEDWERSGRIEKAMLARGCHGLN